MKMIWGLFLIIILGNYTLNVSANNQTNNFSVDQDTSKMIDMQRMEFAGNTYQYFNDELSWEEAKAACENMGGHLATITSEEEQRFIKSLIDNCTKDYYWLGGTDRETEGVWKWVTGEEFSFKNWSANNPDNFHYPEFGYEDYLGIVLYSDFGAGKGEWNDYSVINDYCTHGYICEWEGTALNEISFMSDNKMIDKMIVKSNDKITNQIIPIRKQYQFKGWYQDKNYNYKWNFKNKVDSNMSLYAKWVPKNYNIIYILNKGANNKSNPKTYNIDSENLILRKPFRKGFIFKGWYIDHKYKSKISNIIRGNTGNKKLYAKWSKVTVDKGVLSKLQNVKRRALKVEIKSLPGVSGYQIQYSTNKKFIKNTSKSTYIKKVSAKYISKKIKNLKKHKIYFVRVRAYKIDSLKKGIYGKWSRIQEVKITR